MNIQQTIDILEAAKKVIGPDKRIVFYLDDGSVLGRYFEIVEGYTPAKTKDFIGGDYNGELVTIEITEEKQEKKSEYWVEQDRLAKLKKENKNVHD